MSEARPTNWHGWQTALILVGLAALVLPIAWSLRGLVTDDPYITYRYARNLALGRGLVYNVGEQVLSTTTSFYAVLLATGAILGADIPTLSNALGALAFWAAATSLFLLGLRHGRLWGGLVAAILCASAPLLWLTLGFETGLYVALVCWAFWAFDARRWALCALLLALATITRNDAAVAAGVMGLAWLIEQRSRRGHWRYILLYAAIVGGFAVWLTVQFGSPVPVTLAAKAIHARFGLTGFYPGTTFLQGGVILWRAWSEQILAYWLVLPLVLFGVGTLRRTRWAWGVVAWSGLMMVAYVVLRVAPYPWYYAPLVPTVALLVGLGAEDMGRRVARLGMSLPGLAVLVVVALALPLVGAQLFSLNRVARAQQGPLPQPEEVAAKVLPEAKTAIYRRVGEWLAANTSPEATVGVLEVGVIGYYSDRRIVDFLGLLQPAVAQALARGDIFWAVPAYAPDYLALTAVNPLYTYPILEDEWFQRAYWPVVRFEDARFWGSPITIYRRVEDESPLYPHTVNRPVADGVTLVAWAADGPHLRPGTPLRVRLTWHASAPAALDGAQVSVYLVDADWREAGQRVLRYDTSAWPTDEDVQAYHPLVVADDIPVGRYSLRMRVEDTEGVERFEGEMGWLKCPPGSTVPPEAIPLDVRGDFVHLRGYTLSPAVVRAGQSLMVTLYWAAQTGAGQDWTVFVHMLDGAGQHIAQDDGQPLDGRYPTTVWGAGEVVPDDHVLVLPDSLPAGPYQLLVGLYDLSSGERLALFDGDWQPLPERASRLEVP
ncbi:MAG: hypothetical protein SWK90_14010 [Chloroflexota bacterium]|nr:hypothetical protein [Chloroflexota bacterium]